MVDIKIEGNRVKLDNYKLRNVSYLAEEEIITVEETFPMFDEVGRPLLNDSGEPIIVSKFTKTNRVFLHPEIKQEVKTNRKSKNIINKEIEQESEG